MRLLTVVVASLSLLAAPHLAHSAPKKRRTASRRAAAIVPAVILPDEASFRDREVAEACRTALGGARGAVVAMDPYTGRVQAVVNPEYGLMRAFQPCSVFKIVVAVAGLTEGVITPDTLVPCTRGCWMWPGHGAIDLRRALAVSCNPYFERVGEQLGYAKIERYAQMLALGTPTGINLSGETPGRLPVSVRPSEVGHLSSHAAGITTSAMQIAVLLSAAVNGGTVFQPQVGGIRDFVPKERWRLPPETNLRDLANGFLSAVNEGSAVEAFDPNVLVAGKTGTCSKVGWFASYAPADRPELVVVVFLQGGSGHRASAVAGRIYQALFRMPESGVPAAGR